MSHFFFYLTHKTLKHISRFHNRPTEKRRGGGIGKDAILRYKHTREGAVSNPRDWFEFPLRKMTVKKKKKSLAKTLSQNIKNIKNKKNNVNQQYQPKILS